MSFNPEILSFGKLLEVAQATHCASVLYSDSKSQREAAKQAKLTTLRSLGKNKFRTDQLKYYLNRTPLRSISMTELQAARINAAIQSKKPWKQLLSPRQKKPGYAPWPQAIRGLLPAPYSELSGPKTVK